MKYLWFSKVLLFLIEFECFVFLDISVQILVFLHDFKSSDLGIVVVVQLLSCVQLSATPWTATCLTPLSFTICQSLLKPQTNVHWVSTAIKPPHPLPPCSLAFSLSQNQGLFQWVGSSHQVTKILELQLQHQSSQWVSIQGWFPLGLTGLISLLSKGLSRVFSKCHSSKATVLQCSAFFTVQVSQPYMTTENTTGLSQITFNGCANLRS